MGLGDQELETGRFRSGDGWVSGSGGGDGSLGVGLGIRGWRR